MIDLMISNLTKEFEVGSKLLDGLTFQVDSGERVGLLGRNGAGKTTLFKIITGELDYDSGEVMVAPGKRVGLISQIPVYPAEYTVETVLDTAFLRLHEIEKELAALTEKISAGSSDRADLRRYDRLTEAFESGGGYDTETRKNKVCNGLDISGEMRARLFSELSGGEKTRVNLARLILEDTDILLLDEPTNHLDLRATEWLEEYLSKFKGTVLAISHDRYFLDRVVNRIVELSGGKAEFYAGNYSFYVQEKEARYLEKLKQYEKEQAKVQQLQAAADKLHLWAFMGADKLHKRAFSMEKRIERMQTTDKPRKEKKLSAKFGEEEFRGDEVLTVKGLEKSFDGRTLFSDVNLEVIGGERIGLLGDNGTGKTTMLKILLGEELPDGGKVKFGPTVKVGYLPQIVRFSHPERTLVDTMIYEQDCTPQTARNRLAAFNFQGDDVFKQVKSLSGGEQSRLRLCMLMDEKINLLILDEPTNHLDVDSREWMENAVESYGGNLLFVSHDRYFINKFATRLWILENGQVTDFRGTYQEFQAQKARNAALNQAKPGKTGGKGDKTAQQAEPKKEKPRRGGGTKQLEKETAAAERAVTQMEERIFELTEQAKEDDVATDYLKLQDIYDEQHRLEEELITLYARWEALAAELEEAKNGGD